MRNKCVKFEGKPVHYQDEAAGRYVHVWQSPLGAYAHVHTTCETHYCLNVDHMQVTRPKKLAYPHGVCVYCGQTGSTRDHLEPVTWTGEAARRFVVTVPACGECNSMIGDSFAPTVPARRAIAHAGIRKKYKRILNRVSYTADELDEFEGMLREAVIDGMAERTYVLSRLVWPDDEGYDVRALDKSELDSGSLSELLPHA